MDFSFIIDILPTLIKTLPLTIYILVIAAFFGFLFAIVVAAVRIRHIPVISQLFAVYASFMRSTKVLIILTNVSWAALHVWILHIIIATLFVIKFTVQLQSLVEIT